MALEDWESSDDEAPEEQNVSVSKKSQLQQQKEQQKLANEQRSKEKSQRREIQQRRELEKLEKQKQKLLEDSENEDDIPEELPMDILENFEEIKPTKVIFNEEEQKLEQVPKLIDIKRARVAKLREMRSVTSKKVEGGINVQKVTKQSIKTRKLDTGLNNFKSNWLNRESIKRS